MAKLSNKTVVDDTSIPNRIVIDFLEGTLRKKDAIAFARGFIEHHFDSLTASGYFVMPYDQGYIFEAQEGGTQRAYLPGIMKALDEDPAASACVQMARRIMEVKRSTAGTYTAVLLPEGTESQNEDISFPPAGPKLIPFKRSGMAMLYTGLTIATMGLIVFVLSVLFWLVEVTGLMSPTMRTINLSALPLTQWQTLENLGGEKSDNYVKTLHYDGAKGWQEDKAARQQFNGGPALNGNTGTADLSGLPPGVQPVTGQAPSAPGQPTPLPANPMPGNPQSGNPQSGNPLPSPRTAMPGNALPAPPSLPKP